MTFQFLRPLFYVARRCGAMLFTLVVGLAGPDALAQAPLSLPFFDDFSTAAGRPGVDQPDPARWQPGSGVYINNTLGINQPTVNVASFDGLRVDSRPYVSNNQFAQGYTDTLASRPITLAGLSAADSVYLSFYWQSRGLGEAPDAGDSLTVQFLDQAGTWQTVWRVEGGRPDNNFVRAFIPVLNPAFFHAGFTFRFRSFSRQSGPFDTWNVDYVYMNRGRSVNDQFTKDVAVRQALSPLLRRYTAMPLSQFLVQPAAELADSVTTDINNLFNNFNFTTFRFTITDELTGRVVQDQPQTNSVLIPQLSSQRKSIRPQPITDLGSATSAVLRYKIDLLTTDDQNPLIAGINLRQNDTLSGRAELTDYYAYDDGTWEFAQQINQREQVAVRFVLNKPDAIAGVRACIVPIRTNQSGQPFVVSVYGSANGRPGPVLYRKSFTTQYPARRNGFVDFQFDRGIPVTDTFYVGYQQISASDTTLLRLGFDKNSPFGNQIFYNGGTTWEQNLASPSLNVQGAFLLRPIMGAPISNVVTALPDAEPLRPLHVFPNPTTGRIQWDVKNMSRIEVFTPAGRMLSAIEPTRGRQTLDLSHLPDGVYLLRLTDDQRTTTQKLIVQH